MELASFYGLSKYYRDLVPAFAARSDLLYRATRVPVIELTFDLEQAFNRMKALQLDRPIVQILDPQRDFILETDASTVALGAVLKQEFTKTRFEHPVGLFSRGLTDNERH